MINIEQMRKGYYTRAYNNIDNIDNIDNTENTENIDNIDNIDNTDNTENIDNTDNTDNTDNNRIKYYRISNGFKEANDAVIKFNKKDKTKS